MVNILSNNTMVTMILAIVTTLNFKLHDGGNLNINVLNILVVFYSITVTELSIF